MKKKKKKTGVTGSNVVVGIQIVKKLRLNRTVGRGGRKRRKNGRANVTLVTYHIANYSRNREKENI